MDSHMFFCISALLSASPSNCNCACNLAHKLKIGRLLLRHLADVLQPEILELVLLIFQVLTRFLQLVFEELRGTGRLLLAGLPVLIDKKRRQLIGNLRNQPGVFSTV